MPGAQPGRHGLGEPARPGDRGRPRRLPGLRPRPPGAVLRCSSATSSSRSSCSPRSSP
ncbi:MAG TPA: hypothetical protein VFX88_12440 [Actinomycetota bacterium]|nr:hypothetical protein [Actinomycetota bacterium]